MNRFNTQLTTFCLESRTSGILFIFLLCISQSDAARFFYQVDINEEQNGTLTFGLSPVMPRNIAGNQYYMISEDYKHYFLDSPLRRTAELLLHHQAENSKAESYPDNWREKQLIKLDFRLSITEPSGREFQTRYHRLFLGLGEEPGTFKIVREDGELEQHDIDSLNTEEGYKNLITRMLAPLEGSYPIHKSGNQVVELHMKWPSPLKKSAAPENWYARDITYTGAASSTKTMAARSSQNIGESALTGRAPMGSSDDDYRQFSYQLGSAFMAHEENGLTIYTNHHTTRLRHSINNLTRALNQTMKGHYRQALPLLESYFRDVPSDRKAARYLLQLYGQTEDKAQRLRLTENFQPYFVSFADTSDQVKAGKKAEDAVLTITTPGTGDLVAGQTTWQFVVKDHGSAITRLDYFLDGQAIPGPRELPFHGTFTPPRTGDFELLIRAHFQDGSYQEDRVEFKAIKVDQERSTRLVELQTVVLDGKKPVTDLSADQITLFENGVVQQIAALERISQPKHVTFLVDTSLSQRGKPIRYVREAVARFWKGLNPQDTMSLYTFDNMVLRQGEFSHDSTDALPAIYGMTPQMGTALNDALLAARSDLMQREQEVRIVVMICDGLDTTSTTTEKQIQAILKRSPIRVYTVHVSKAKDKLLGEIAEVSGGFYRQSNRPSGLARAMDRIHTELNALYYVNYYSELDDDQDREIKLEVPGRITRSLALNRNRSTPEG